MGNFKKGIFLGGLLGAGLMWLNATKKGKQTRDKMLDYSADVYADVKEKVMASEGWDKMTKSKYYQIVEEAVNKYAVENDLVDSVRNMVEKVVKAQWKKGKK
ncbi:MAG: YtxH domain-containing protein [Candidatus Magasanikbacteria bacterium]|nr:YtxH domain-containing protein [Candidatus Magasanikbacteria bacterium]